MQDKIFTLEFIWKKTFLLLIWKLHENRKTFLFAQKFRKSENFCNETFSVWAKTFNGKFYSEMLIKILIWLEFLVIEFLCKKVWVREQRWSIECAGSPINNSFLKSFCKFNKFCEEAKVSHQKFNRIFFTFTIIQHTEKHAWKRKIL